MKRLNVEFNVKAGSRDTLTLTLNCADTGSPVSMACVCAYDTGTWKVWKPNGTIVFCGGIVYSCRAGGQVTYALAACDVTNTCAGIWEGEVEYINTACTIIDQSDSFTFKIKESF